MTIPSELRSAPPSNAPNHQPWPASVSARVAPAGARTLVIVAEPDGPADGLYRSLGFADRELQVELGGRWMRGE